ncbi:lengsin [Spea bombifrons]|uniref:lengsin n=1 Tax=Spea bombifrons TaxID=233779 RepID=UPI00234AEB2E|nr:lengsin [Spea bombifrons]
MDNETNTVQKLAITEKDEVDGSVVSRIRRQRGVKVTGKYIPPLKWEKITSHFASSMNHSNFEKIYDNMENVLATSYETSHNMSTKPLHKDEGQDYSDTNIRREDSSKMKQEKQSVDTMLVESQQTSSSKNTEDTSQEKVKYKTSDKHVLAFGSAMPKETLEELKNLLKESPLITSNNKFSPKHSTYIAHIHLPKSGENAVVKPGLTFETFGPNVEKHIPRLHLIKNCEAIQPMETTNHKISTGFQQSQEEKETAQPIHLTKSLSQDKSSTATGIPFDIGPGDFTDFRRFTNKNIYSCGSAAIQTSLDFASRVEHIQQQMAREDIHFVRFEAADLHGVSRSKTIPARFFHEKAISGVYMPRSYLELTRNPKDNEVDHINVAHFNSDIILKPDIKTFRILPWAYKTGRVICDSYTDLGDPLLTSPRYVYKQLLNQLQESGFSLCAAFTYEFCIFGVAEIINSKTIAFPAATLMTDHDQLFMQELFDGMYYTGGSIESFSSSHRPGQVEVSFQPEYGLTCADNTFTFRTGIKEVAKKHSYIASFYTGNEGFWNSGLLSHSLWDLNGAKNLFYNESQVQQLTDIGKKWLSGLLHHSAALSCLVAPGISCRKRFLKDAKDSQESICATWAYNDNSSAYNIKCHGHNGTYIENKLASATANPYLVLAATVAAGLDGIRRDLDFSDGRNSNSTLHHFKPSSVPLKMEDALLALEEDKYMREALGEAFIQYFIAMKRYELETEEVDSERNTFLEYFI